MIALQQHASNLDLGIRFAKHWMLQSSKCTSQFCERKGISRNAEEKISRSATPKWCRWILSWLSGVFAWSEHLQWSSYRISLHSAVWEWPILDSPLLTVLLFKVRCQKTAHIPIVITPHPWRSQEDMCLYKQVVFLKETIHAHHACCNPIHNNHLAHLPQPCHLWATKDVCLVKQSYFKTRRRLKWSGTPTKT